MFILAPLAPLAPLALVALGVILLIGCIPVPATRQLQPDNRLRPEHVVGYAANKPVRLGQTRIEDAFMELSRRTGTKVDSAGWSTVRSGINPPWSIMNWRVSPDRRHFTVEYQVRTQTDVYPLCFFYAQEQTERRWLTLDVDEHGIVTGSTTSAQDPPYSQPAWPDEWLRIFDDSQRRKLRAAGFLPDDAVLEEGGRLMRQATQPGARRMRPPPSASPSTAPSDAERFWRTNGSG